MSLGGLLRHLAHCENWQFSQRLFNEAPAEPWASDTSWDDDWTLAATETAEVLYARWQFHVDRSRALMTRALANGGLEQSLQRPWPNGATSSLRRLLADLLEEYARHVGHADLLREAIDGVVGEDPPNAFE